MIQQSLAGDLNNTVLPMVFNAVKLHDFYSTIFPYFVGAAPTLTAFDARYWQARTLFEDTLFDKNSAGRKSIVDAWEFAQEKVSPADFASRYSEVERSLLPVDSEEVLPFIYADLGYQSIPKFETTKDELYVILKPFFDSISIRLSTDELFEHKLIWDVLQDGYDQVREVFWIWLYETQKRNIVPFAIADVFKTAIDLCQRAENKLELTKFEYLECLELLDNKSRVLAAAAAYRLGSAYDEYNVSQTSSWILPLAESLELLYVKQTQGACVVGAFLDNILAGEGLAHLKLRPDLKSANFDVRNWVLKTAIDSSGPEPFIYPTQSFWFFVHEYFDNDADAVMKLIEGEHYWLAMMCATESLDHGSLEVMRPVLKQLLLKASADIQNQVKKLLEFKNIKL